MTIPAADLQTLDLNKSTLQKAWGITAGHRRCVGIVAHLLKASTKGE